MSYFTLRRRARVMAVAAMSAGLLVAGPAITMPAHAGTSGTSGTETSGQASAQVQHVLARVHALAARAHAAEARYARAFSAVADSVNVAITADQDSTAITQQESTAQATLSQQVRGLYESSDPLAGDAAVLTSGNFNSLAVQKVLTSSALRQQFAGVQAAVSLADRADAAASKAEKREHLTIGTERTVSAAADQVESLLAQQKLLLASADKKLAAVRQAEAALAAESSNFSAITTRSVAGLHILPPSAQYLALYKAAAPTCPGLSWTVLAAIGQVESGHGRNPSTSSAGAMGPMQFEPATFAAYAVDGDHDGTVSIMDPADAIFTAAHYLCANGAGASTHGLSAAIFHYNHAIWYVDTVLTLAGMYATAYPS